MPRLIDANALLKRLRISYLYHKVNPYIVNAPTVDAVEVVHGRWDKYIDDDDDTCCRCTACGWRITYEDCTLEELGYNYCPNCGAKMDGGNEDV